MIVAAIEGQLLILLLMAVFGFISWLSGKLNPGEKKPPQRSAPRADAPKRRAAAESEEERMRRFLEALGMPADQAPAQEQRRAAPPPVPTAPPPIPARQKRKQRPVPPPPPVVVERSLDELETTTLPVEQIALPELVTSQTRDFETVTSSISASHQKVPASREAAPVSSSAPIHQLLRAALASPQQLRTAFLLREILGPPPGLR
jgi:hypothetical protein